MGKNKTINLDEEFFMREKTGGVSYIRPLEYFITFLKVEEDIKSDFLLVVSKTGKIKIWRINSLLNRIGKSRKQLLAQKRVMLRCQKHQKEIVEHQSFSGHSCGIFCKEIRKLNDEIKKCSQCQIILQEDDDEIKKAVLIKENDQVYVIIKKS